MNILETNIGTRLEIELLSSTGGKIGQTYISQLLDVFDSNNVIIAVPSHETKFMLIPTDTRIRVIFQDKNQGLLSFIGTIVKKQKNENMLTFHTRIDSPFEKIQRRNHFRLECVLDAAYFLCNESEEQSEMLTDSAAREYKKALTKNLSGSGACIVTDEDIPKNSRIEVVICLGKAISIKVLCNVARSSALDTLCVRKFAIGLHFIKITAKDENELVKFIFNKQRALLKKSP